MQRFFFDDEQITNGVFEVTGEKHNHISKVLRLAVGELVIFCDGNYTDSICRLDSVDSKTARFSIVEKRANDTEADLKVTVFQCVPKGDKLDEMVKRSVQFGVYEVVPVLSKRCVSRPDPKNARKKLERLNKIARSSAMQSMRGLIPKVKDFIDFEHALIAMKEYDTAFLCYENEEKKLITDLEIKGNVAVLIGPEGGFDPSEVEKADMHGIKSVSLGRRILRTEDAAPFLIPVLFTMTKNI